MFPVVYRQLGNNLTIDDPNLASKFAKNGVFSKDNLSGQMIERR